MNIENIFLKKAKTKTNPQIKCNGTTQMNKITVTNRRSIPQILKHG